MYKIVGTTIKVQTDAGLVELESITGPSPESREALDNFFQKWKILSVDTTIRQIPKIPILIPEKSKSTLKRASAIGTAGIGPAERREIALNKVPEIFTINDWVKSFDKNNFTDKQIYAIKKNYAYDIKCLLAENKIIIADKTEHIIKYQIVEKITSQKEKEDALKRINEERNAFEGTFR